MIIQKCFKEGDYVLVGDLPGYKDEELREEISWCFAKIKEISYISFLAVLEFPFKLCNKSKIAKNIRIDELYEITRDTVFLAKPIKDVGFNTEFVIMDDRLLQRYEGNYAESYHKNETATIVDTWRSHFDRWNLYQLKLPGHVPLYPKMHEHLYPVTALQYVSTEFFRIHSDYDFALFEMYEEFRNGMTYKDVEAIIKGSLTNISKEIINMEKKLIATQEIVKSKYANKKKGTTPGVKTTVTIDYNGGKIIGSAIIAKDNPGLDERQGILEAIANAVCGENFESFYRQYKRDKAAAELKERKCPRCGCVYDTPEDANACVEYHINNKRMKNMKGKARREAKRKILNQLLDIEMNKYMADNKDMYNIKKPTPSASKKNK